MLSSTEMRSPPPSPPTSPPWSPTLTHSLPPGLPISLPPIPNQPVSCVSHTPTTRPYIYRLSMFFTIFEPPPRAPRQSPRSYDYSIARARDLAYSEFCKYYPCARRLCTWIVLKYLLCAPARARARIAEHHRRSVLLRITSRPLCVRYVLILRALASTRARIAAATFFAFRSVLAVLALVLA